MNISEKIIMQIDNHKSAENQIFEEAERILAKQRRECDDEDIARLVASRALGQRIGEAVEAIVQPEAHNIDIDLPKALNIAGADHPSSGHIVGSMSQNASNSILHQILTHAIVTIDWNLIGRRYINRIIEEE